MGKYIRLVAMNSANSKQEGFFDKKNQFIAEEELFKDVPGYPYAYWISPKFREAFLNGSALETIATPRKGLATTDNDRFLRRWFEVDFGKSAVGCKDASSAEMSHKKWFPLNKGGEYRKWYGNKSFFINWENNGKEIKETIVKKYNGGSYTKEIRSEDKYFKDGITWSALTGSTSSFRKTDYGALFDSAGSSMFPGRLLNYVLGLLNTKIVNEILNLLNPTLNFGAGTISQIPVLIDEEKNETITECVEDNVKLAKEEWDEFEVSWDFKRHPLC